MEHHLHYSLVVNVQRACKTAIAVLTNVQTGTQTLWGFFSTTCKPGMHAVRLQDIIACTTEVQRARR